MIILFDTNVILDALLDREPFGEHALALFDAVESSRVSGYIGAHSVTTLFYLMEKVKTTPFARRKIGLLLDMFEVAPVTRAVLANALESDFSDFEDAVVYQAALHACADGIVTRNGADFRKAKIAVYTPAELAAAVAVS